MWVFTVFNMLGMFSTTRSRKCQVFVKINTIGHCPGGIHLEGWKFTGNDGSNVTNSTKNLKDSLRYLHIRWRMSIFLIVAVFPKAFEAFYRTLENDFLSNYRGVNRFDNKKSQEIAQTTRFWQSIRKAFRNITVKFHFSWRSNPRAINGPNFKKYANKT